MLIIDKKKRNIKRNLNFKSEKIWKLWKIGKILISKILQCRGLTEFEIFKN